MTTRALFATTLIFILSCVLNAQNIAGTMEGIVVDDQRAVLPGVSITITNVDTGIIRTIVTDGAGSYRAPALQPGTYELTAELQGFTIYKRTGLSLTIGQESRIDITLQVATVRETVEVTGAAPLVDVSSNTIGTTITRKDLESLPLATRNFLDLANMTPGVTGVGGGGVNTSGQLSRNNSFLIDGVSNDNTLVSSSRGGFSLEAVREYVVLANQFSAEYGVSSGAIVSVVTRSGTNKTEGRAFIFDRNAHLDAQDPFSHAQGSGKAPFSQQRFGGFLGGPVAKDNLFYFVSYEGLRVQQTSVVTSIDVPVDQREFPNPNNQHQGLVKFDKQVTSQNSATLRYRVDDLRTKGDGIGGLNTLDRGADNTNNNQDLVFSDNAIASSRLLNEFRFQYGRSNRYTDTENYSPVGTPQINRPSGNFGKSATNPQGANEKRLQFVDNVSYSASSHSIKAGADISIIRGLSFFPRNRDGTFTFATDKPFNAADLSTYPTQYVHEQFIPDVALPNELYGFFAQDAWRASSSLTLNVGVRYDLETSYGHILDVNDDRNNIQPRLGFVWAPFHDNRTAIRGGWGIYSDRSFTNVQLDVAAVKDGQKIVINNPGYPDPTSRGTVTATPSTTVVQPNPRSPETQTTSLGFQHELRPGLTTSIDGVYSVGYNLFNNRDVNYPTFPGGPRPNPAQGQLIQFGMEGHSWSTALLASLQYRPGHGPLFGISYTLSRALRDVEDFQSFAQNELDQAAEKGPGNNDRTHQLVGNFTASLPYGIQLAGLASYRSGLPWTVTTGRDNNLDLTINDRPDLAVVGGDPLDKATYFTNFTNRVGNLGRNTNRGFNYFTLDMRLSKYVVIPHARIELFGEAFNLTNYTNFGLPNGNLLSSTFGKPSALATGAAPRRVELGARVNF
jgi:hypothetical protein